MATRHEQGGVTTPVDVGVLREEMGIRASRALGAVRRSLGYDNAAAEIDATAAAPTGHG